MTGIRFQVSDDGRNVHLFLSYLQPDQLTVDFLRNQFNLTEYRYFHELDAAFNKALGQYQAKISQVEPGCGLSEPVSQLVAERRDASVDIEVTDDRMSCSLRISTAEGGPNPDTAALTEFLNKKGITKGLNRGLLDALAKKLNNVAPGSQIQEVVATGKPPGQSRQARLEILVLPVQDRLMKPKLRDDGTVDMHDFGEIEMVEVGDPLVRRIPPVVGEPGYNVMGELVSATKPQDRELEMGEGTQISPDSKNLLVAARRGVPLRVSGGMMVSDAYCINDVDLNTGNVDFDGTVVVKGTVREGMEVRATGKVLIRDYLESASVIAGDEVVIGKGVLGKQVRSEEDQAEAYAVSIETPATVFSNYIQYARIRAGGIVTAAKHIMHSDIQAEAIVVESPKRTEGKIIGGYLRPRSQLVCNTLGSPSYIPTFIDFSHQFSQQLTELTEIRDQLGERLHVIRGMKEALRGFEGQPGSDNDVAEQVRKIRNTISHFEQEVERLKHRRQELIADVTAVAETLEVVVQRDLFPGVEINFLQQWVPVKDERDACRIKMKDKSITYFTLS
ncbi:MAG: hypothetical protein CML06_19445 [Pseudomonadales bacterium]|nr:hypothetical protein [Pseudomonadales bacterium]